MKWHTDPMIDDLIAANKARYLPGMERPDLETIEQMGRARWREIEAAQQKMEAKRQVKERWGR